MHLVRYMNIYLYSGKIQYWLCSSLINWEKVILTCAYNILYCKIPVPTSPSLLFIWFMWQQSNRKHLTGWNTPLSLWLIRLYANLFIQMVYYDFWGGLKPTQLERQCIYHYYIGWGKKIFTLRHLNKHPCFMEVSDSWLFICSKISVLSLTEHPNIYCTAYNSRSLT